MALINDLQSAGILTQEDAKLLQQSSKSKKQTPQDSLNLLYRHFIGKVFQRDSSGGFHMVIIAPTEDATINQDDTKGYLRLLQILFDHGIISNAVYQKLNNLPIKGDLHGYTVGLQIAANLTKFYNEFTIEKQLEFAKILAGSDKFERDSMLQSHKKKKLLKDIKAEKLTTYLDFFEYCHGCFTIDTTQYFSTPKKLLKKLVKPINNIIFDAFTVIDINLTQEAFQGNPSYHDTKATIAINTGERIDHYEYTLKETGTKAEYKIKELLTSLLTALNQLLAAYNCLYRLTGITDSADDDALQTGKKRFAICLVHTETVHIFDFYDMQRRFLLNKPMIANFRLPLSYKKIQYALHHFKESGILSHLSDEKFYQITRKIYESNYENVADLLKIFPDTVITLDRNVLKGRKPYHDFLLSLNNISRGVLNITDVTDNTPEDTELEAEATFDITFSCNGKNHQVECIASYGEFDDRIIYYIINEIIRKEYKKYQLLQLIQGDHQKDVYLFASDTQIRYLSKMKLIQSIDRFF